MNHPAAQAATLPFQILENQGIPSGYERSCKLLGGKLYANRYLLGINKTALSADQVLDICRQLQAPEELIAPFLAGLPEANLLLIGFEGHEQTAGVYKLYLEYWDKLRASPGFPRIEQSRFLLHRGFKWHIDAPHKQAVTDYHFIPGLNTEQLLTRIRQHFDNSDHSAVSKALDTLVRHASKQAAGQAFIYVEVSEQGNPRCSFDLNLYPAGLKIRDVLTPLHQLATALQTDLDKFERLLQIIQDKPLGHISAGTARDEQPYFTFYYEY